MIVTLNSTFTICNGADITAAVLDTEGLRMQQTTQETLRSRAECPTYFHSRASRVIPLVYPVTYPPCASFAAAALEARQIIATCPKGGVLTEQQDGTLITYADSKVESIEVTRRGVTNQFTFTLTAVDPDTAALSTLAQLNMSYIANLHTITSLTGGTATALDGYVTTDVTVGFTAFLPALVIGSIAQAKMMQLVTGTDAENADPTAGLIVIRPDDYHASTNAKVWKEKL